MRNEHFTTTFLTFLVNLLYRDDIKKDILVKKSNYINSIIHLEGNALT